MGSTRTIICMIWSHALYTLSYRGNDLDRRTGLEPVSRDSKSRVLPLDDQRIAFGAPTRTQTPDLRLRAAALYSLSYRHVIGQPRGL